MESREEASHGGVGTVRNFFLYGEEDFETRLRFIIYTEIEPGSSIGEHRHGENEEVYVILEGDGVMAINGELRLVKAGDVVLNKPGGSHGLENSGTCILRILVFEVDV